MKKQSKDIPSGNFGVQDPLNYPMVSIIILNYNGQKILGKILTDCIESVFKTNYPNFEVLFIDNASTDSSVEFIKKKFGENEKLRIIVNDRNYGFTEGNNIGIRNASGDYFALLNTDTKVDPQWLKELVNAIQPPEIGAAQSKLIKMQDPNILDCAGGWLDFYGYHFERGQGEKTCLYEHAGEIFYGKGAGLILKRTVLEKTGLFDSDLFMYFDESDLCWRIWLSGHKVVFVPKSIVFHASGLTASNLKGKRMFFYARNHLAVLLKNYSLGNVVRTVTVSIFYETRNIIKFLFKRKTDVSIAIFQGLLWNLFNLKAVWKKRLVVQNFVRKISDEEVKKRMLPPYPPFPLYLIFSRFRYSKKGKNINT